MEYLRLEHPPDRLFLCNRSNCEDIADYLEVNEQSREEFVCAAHTNSQRHASVLPKAVPLVVLIRAEADLLPDPRRHSDHK
jgi:hypothetical protein